MLLTIQQLHCSTSHLLPHLQCLLRLFKIGLLKEQMQIPD
jgi:hypothetical protein